MLFCPSHSFAIKFANFEAMSNWTLNIGNLIINYLANLNVKHFYWSDNSSLLNLKQLVHDLIRILDQLMFDDFNYFPSITNAVQTSLLHLFTLPNSSSMIVDIIKSDENVLKRLITTSTKLYTISISSLENEQNLDSVTFKDDIDVFSINLKLYI